MEQQRLNTERACCTDRWHTEQQRINNEKASCTHCWHIKRQRVYSDRACCAECWHTEQQRLNTKTACCTDKCQTERQRFNSIRVCAKCQCQEYSTDCRYLDEGLLDQPVKPVVKPDKDVVKIAQMTGGIINIYHHPTTEDKKSCFCVRGSNNQVTEEKYLRENRKTKQKKKNPFHKFFSFCRRRVVRSTSSERTRKLKVIQTTDQAVQHMADVETSLNDGQDVHSDRVHTSANVHAHFEFGKANQPEEQFRTTNKADQHTTSVETSLDDREDVHSDRVLTSAYVKADFEIGKQNRLEQQSTHRHSSQISLRPNTRKYTESCPQELRLSSNKCTVKDKREIDSPSEQLIKESKEIEKIFKDQSNVFSIRKYCDPMKMQENNTHTIQKRQSEKCKVVEASFHKLTNSCNQLPKETISKKFQTQIKQVESPVSNVNFEKKLFDVDDESFFDDENDYEGLLRGQNEDLSRSDRHCQSDIEALADLKLSDPNFKQEETEAKAFVNVRAISTKSSTLVKTLSSGYPLDTNCNDSEGLSKDICNSSDFTRNTETSLETTNNRPVRSYKVTGIDSENYKKSDKNLVIIHRVDTTNEENSCGYDSGKESQSSRITDGEEGTACNINCNGYNTDLNDLRSKESNSFQRDKNTSLDQVNSNTRSLGDSKELKIATNEEKSCSYDSEKKDKSSRNSDGEEGTVCIINCGNDKSIDLIDLRSYESNSPQHDKNIILDPVSSNIHRLSDRKDVNEKVSSFGTDENTKSLNFPTTQQIYRRKENTPTSLLRRRYIKEEINMCVPDTNEKAGSPPQAVNVITESQNKEDIVSPLQNEKTSDLQSVPFIDKNKKERKRHKTEYGDSACGSSKIRQQKQTVPRKESESSGSLIHEKQVNEENDSVNNVDLLSPKTKIPTDRDCTIEMLNTSESKELELSTELGNHFSSEFQFENKNVWLINSRKEKERREKQIIHDYNHHKKKKRDATRNNLESKNDAFPSHKRLPSSKYVNNRDVDNCKLSETTKISKSKRLKYRYSCRKKVPKPEISSTFFKESINQTSSVLPAGSNKLKRNQRKKNKKSYLKQSWQKDERLLGWQFIDSGIGTSGHSERESEQQLKENENTSYLIKLKTGNSTKEIGSCNTLSFFVKKKSDFQLFGKQLRRFITEKRRTFVKHIVRELYIEPRRTEKVYGLDRYFDNFTNRLHYEWLRLESFRNYAGNGSGIVLARNGFFHDHGEGPRATRCYLCNARNSSWEMFDDVKAEHRRQSPECPFNSDSGQVSQNIPITDNSEASPRTSTQGGSPTASNNTAFTTARPADSDLTETSEAGATTSFQRLQISGDLITRGESISQQPTEDRESRDRSLFALPRPRPQNAIGRSGQPYSTIQAPKRNNVATSARSNIGLGPTEGSSTASWDSNLNSQSMLAGPVAAGAFTGLSTRTQIPVSTAAEALQGSHAALTATSTTEGCGPGPGTGRQADTSFTVVVDNPKHPEYQNTESRISSYQGWPDYLDQTARQMAEAGFFFVGVADFTRCFCCGGGLRNWEPGDDPMLEHARWFPRCEYVNKLKGERYVAAVQRRHQDHMAEQQRQQAELAQRRDEHRSPPDPMTTETAEILLEMGYTAERTREAILAVRQERGLSDVSTQQVLTWLLDDEERRLNANAENNIETSPANTTATAAAQNVQQTGSSNSVSAENTPETGNEPLEVNETTTVTAPVSNSNIAPGKETEQKKTAASTNSGQQTGAAAAAAAKPGSSSGESDESKSRASGNTVRNEPTIRETKKKKTRKKAKVKGSGTASSAARELDAKSLKAENEKLREMQTCKICMEQPVNTTLLPCGHLVCCGSCAPRLQRCPICSKIIKGTVKTFMS